MNICNLDLPVVDDIGMEAIKPTKYGQTNGSDSISIQVSEIDSVYIHNDCISPDSGTTFSEFYDSSTGHQYLFHKGYGRFMANV